MEVSKVYVIDSTNFHEIPIESKEDANQKDIMRLFSQYHNAYSHIPFVHHIYSNYWDKGIPIIQLTNMIDEGFSEVFNEGPQYLTVFLPAFVTVNNGILLQDVLHQIKKEYPYLREEKLIYIQSKQNFGYNYEVYPPLLQVREIPFEEGVDLYLRDSHNLTSMEEKEMFLSFRVFNMESMLTNEDSFYLPVNHNCCGVLIVDREGERYTSPVTKTGHQETANYLLSCITGEDVASKKISMLREVNNYSCAILLFRDGDIFSFLPEKINDQQSAELNQIADEVEAIGMKHHKEISIVASRVLLSDDIVDEEYSFRDVVSIANQSFHKDIEEKRGSIK